MSATARRLLAGACGLVLLAALLLLVSLNNLLSPDARPALILREVNIAPPPPPPPPPPPNPRQSELDRPDLARAAEQPPLPPLMPSPFEGLEVPAGRLTGDEWGGLGEGLGLQAPVVDLTRLDETPMPVYDPTLEYPEELAAAGMRSFRVLLHIRVNTDGSSTLIRVLENPYPQINPELKEYVSKFRFTPPLSAGLPVKAEFTWPLEFKL